MALTDAATEGEVPVDSFRIRIAMIRALKGWNAKQAAEACGVDDESWRRWERTTRKPRDYEAVCQKIADATGFDIGWIKAGGPLRSRCGASLSSVPLPAGAYDLHLFYDDGVTWEGETSLPVLVR